MVDTMDADCLVFQEYAAKELTSIGQIVYFGIFLYTYLDPHSFLR